MKFFNLRLGIAEDAYVETRSRHESAVLRAYDQDAHALTREHHVLWLLDRAFIDAPFWDKKKRTLGSTRITRMKSNLRIDATEGLPVADMPVNAGARRPRRGQPCLLRRPARAASGAGAPALGPGLGTRGAEPGMATRARA